MRDDQDTRFIPARLVWERYGVTQMSLYRWVNDPASDFPKPTYFGRFRYWKLADLHAWEATRPRGRTRSEAATNSEAAA